MLNLVDLRFVVGVARLTVTVVIDLIVGCCNGKLIIVRSYARQYWQRKHQDR